VLAAKRDLECVLKIPIHYLTIYLILILAKHYSTHELVADQEAKQELKILVFNCIMKRRRLKNEKNLVNGGINRRRRSRQLDLTQVKERIK